MKCTSAVFPVSRPASICTLPVRSERKPFDYHPRRAHFATDRFTHSQAHSAKAAVKLPFLTNTHYRMSTISPQQAIDDTRHWLEAAVIGLNLCPFAKAVHVKKQIRLRHSAATNTDMLLADFIEELELLRHTPAEETDTTLLIHPDVLRLFTDYNDFLGIADATLDALGLAGTFQVASFHPAYQFADTEADDITNYTNRSPHPILHILRESSLDRAIASFPDSERIYTDNMRRMLSLGLDGWNALLEKPES